MKLINDNIYNLTNLWATVGTPFIGYASDDKIGYSRIRTSEWPNKIWSNQKLTTEILQNIKILMKTSQINMSFIDFEFEGNTNHTLIEQYGFELSSSMPGMHLKLTNLFNITDRLSFLMVTNVTEAIIWCDIFKESFGYVISKDIVIKSMNKVHFYIAFDNDSPIGVIKLHLTNDVAGIYSLGVPPNSRGKGYAKEMMHFALNKAIKHRANLATLQASKLGEGMYERMGFKKDFTMNSYKLKTQ